MRRFRPALLFAVLLLNVPPGQAQRVDPTLIKARSDYEAAYQKGDAIAWGRYVLDDALFTGVGGTLETKAERLAKVRPRGAPTSKVSDEKYRDYGNLVIHTWRQDGTNQGESRADRRIEIWIKQNGQWKIASLQITLIE